MKKNQSSPIKKNVPTQKQISMIIDGHKVQLNFSIDPQASLIKDVKRMMLCGIAKV